MFHGGDAVWWEKPGWRAALHVVNTKVALTLIEPVAITLQTVQSAASPSCPRALSTFQIAHLAVHLQIAETG